MFIFYKFASMVVINATKQMSQLHSDFLVAYKENTKALTELVAEFKEHINIKNHALELLEERHRQLEDKYEQLRKFHEP